MNAIPIVIKKFTMQCDHCKHNINSDGWCASGTTGRVIACDDFEPI